MFGDVGVGKVGELGGHDGDTDILGRLDIALVTVSHEIVHS